MNSNRQRLYLPAMGIVNALGNNKRAVFDGLCRVDQSNIIQRNDLLVNDEPCYVAAVQGELAEIPASQQLMDSRNNRLLLTAALQIAPDIEPLKTEFGADRIAVVLGTSTSGIAESEQAIQQHAATGSFPDSYHYQQQEMGSPAEFLAQYFDLKNIAMTVSTACSSSAKVFATARNLIHSGLCDVAIVGGVDTLCQLTLNGFNALASVSPEVCSPFSRNRNGITIGEAAAVFIVSPHPAAIELCGVGESSDAHHMSAPDPEGKGAMRAMQAALDDAQLSADDIDYINLHGTATIKNDEMESLAVSSLFGHSTPCSSTKALTGHTLGAAGATEIGLCWLSLSEFNDQSLLPQHVWDGSRDERLPEIDLIEGRRLISSNRAQHMMSSSFAFGGSNVSVIVGNNLEGSDR